MDKGRIFGGILLLMGCCIGAGMLGLPIMTGLSGFFPSLIAFFCIWAFMTLTGLLVVEVNGWFAHRSHFITMVGRTLGKPGRIACWILYLFLFYILILAYISAIGSLFSKILGQYFSVSFPDWGGSILFVLFFGWVVYMGTRSVDMWNRWLMVGKITTFLVLVIVGVRYVQPALLERSQPDYALFALPILVISFGFQNMIPTLADYLKGDLKSVRLVIILGGLCTLVIYLIWQVIVLGIVPFGGPNGILASLKEGEEASQAIIGNFGTSWVAYAATLLAFFALLTSFLAQALALSHFLADGMNIKSKRHEDFWIVILTLLPPLFFAILYPNIFIKALNFAGGICAVSLFGVLPVLMVWKGRYKRGLASNYQVFGGKPLLMVLFFIALFIAFFELSMLFKAPYLPRI